MDKLFRIQPVEHASDGSPVRRSPDHAPGLNHREPYGFTVSSLRDVEPLSQRHDYVRSLVMEHYTALWGFGGSGRRGRWLVRRGDAIIITERQRAGDEALISGTRIGDHRRPCQAMRSAVADGWDFTGCTAAQRREMVAMWISERLLGSWDAARLRSMR